MSTPAADSFADISRRIREIREAEIPRCPHVPAKTLHSCLRESARCPVTCPYHGDWIGPQAGFVVPLADETDALLCG